MTKRMMKKRALKPAVLAALSVLVLANASEAYYESPIDVSRRDPVAGATRKLGRGLANTGLGWVEIFKGMEDVRSESGFWAGATWGPLYGTMNAVKRTALGVFETATFPFPGSNRYEPVIEPEYLFADGS